jgi:GntR family transcriptional repressor for pyruvate dehydrogenase complex
MSFRKLESKKKSEYVVEQILGATKEGIYKAGDKLPSEQALAEMMGVSRPALREALGALRLVGIIETKVGNGNYIKRLDWDTDNAEVQFQIPSMLEQGENPFEALEARKIVEPAVAQLALSMMNEKRATKIREAFQQMEKAAKERDYNSFHLANKKFHLSIVESTENSSLINYIKSLLNLFTNSEFGQELKRRYLTEKTYLQKALEVHRSILENLQNGNAGKLQKVFVKHFDQVEKQLLGM